MTRRERLYLRHAIALIIGSAIAAFGVLGVVDIDGQRQLVNNPLVESPSYVAVAVYIIFGGMLMGAAISKIADVRRAERKTIKKDVA